MQFTRKIELVRSSLSSYIQDSEQTNSSFLSRRKRKSSFVFNTIKTRCPLSSYELSELSEQRRLLC